VSVIARNGWLFGSSHWTSSKAGSEPEPLKRPSPSLETGLRNFRADWRGVENRISYSRVVAEAMLLKGPGVLIGMEV
jgi:hypothetical protein